MLTSCSRSLCLLFCRRMPAVRFTGNCLGRTKFSANLNFLWTQLWLVGQILLDQTLVKYIVDMNWYLHRPTSCNPIFYFSVKSFPFWQAQSYILDFIGKSSCGTCLSCLQSFVEQLFSFVGVAAPVSVWACLLSCPQYGESSTYSTASDLHASLPRASWRGEGNGPCVMYTPRLKFFTSIRESAIWYGENGFRISSVRERWRHNISSHSLA